MEEKKAENELKAEKVVESAQPTSPQPTPKKSRKGCCLIIFVGLIVLFLGGSATGFMPFLDIFGHNNADDVTKLAPARDYQYSAPSSTALIRTVDCLKVYYYSLDKTVAKHNPLCLNLYKTSADEINQKIASASYDRVFLYGERVIFDFPNAHTGESNYGQKLIDITKFNDQFTLPAVMKLFGVPNLNYIGETRVPVGSIYPLDMMYVRVEDNIGHACGENSGGCALVNAGAIIDAQILNSPVGGRRALSKPGTSDLISYNINWPENCYTQTNLLHELGHTMMSTRGQFNKNGQFVVPFWFDEHISGLMKNIGLEYVCGAGTITDWKATINDKESDMDLIQFSALYPIASLSHAHPTTENTCALAVGTEFYKYLGEGDFATQFAKFFVFEREQASKGNIREDSVFGQIIVDLEKNPTAGKQFLQSKGCSL